MHERSYTDWIEYPHARLRFDLEKDRGTPTRFLVQLEYCVDGEWRPVAHFDHNSEGTYGHDMTVEEYEATIEEYPMPDPLDDESITE